MRRENLRVERRIAQAVNNRIAKPLLRQGWWRLRIHQDYPVNNRIAKPLLRPAQYPKPKATQQPVNNRIPKPLLRHPRKPRTSRANASVNNRIPKPLLRLDGRKVLNEPPRLCQQSDTETVIATRLLSSAIVAIRCCQQSDTETVIATARRFPFSVRSLP